MQTSIRALTALALVVAGLSAHVGAAAATVVSYGFDGNPAAYTPNAVAAHSTANNIAISSGCCAALMPATDALHVSGLGGEYLEFTVEADAGFELDLSSLQILASKGNGFNSAAIALYSSLDGYSLPVYSAGLSTVPPSYAAHTADLSASTFQNVTGPLTFLIFLNGMVPDVYFDSITLNGTVASLAAPVPEAGTGALLLAGLGMVSALGRRRTSARGTASA